MEAIRFKRISEISFAEVVGTISSGCVSMSSVQTNDRADLFPYSLATDQEFYLNAPNVEPVRQFLLNAINSRYDHNTTKNTNSVPNAYELLVSQLIKKDDADIIWKFFISFSSCVTFLTSKSDLFRYLVVNIVI